MTAHNLFVKNQGLEVELRRIWEVWAQRFPTDAANYLALVQQQRKQLWVSSGMSKEGNFAYTGRIPFLLHHLIERRWPGFFRDPKNYMAALRIFMGEDNMPKERKRFRIIEKFKKEKKEKES